MQYTSLSVLVKRVESQIRQVLRKVDLADLTGRDRKFITDLQQNLIDARIYVSSYELSETREEQLDNAKKSKKWLNAALKNILSASESDIFGAIDVAELSAQIERIKDNLK